MSLNAVSLTSSTSVIANINEFSATIIAELQSLIGMYAYQVFKIHTCYYCVVSHNNFIFIVLTTHLCRNDALI